MSAVVAVVVVFEAHARYCYLWHPVVITGI